MSLTKIVPLLNKLVPSGIALKGLQKINPKIGRFLSNGLAAGYAGNEMLDFLRQNFEEEPSNERLDIQAANKAAGQAQQIPRLAGKMATTALGAAGIAAAPEIMSGLFKDQDTEAEPEENIIMKHSPQLFEFLSNHIKSGRKPIEAGNLAQLNKDFLKAIKLIESESQAPFSSVLETVFGGQSQESIQNDPSQQMQPQSGKRSPTSQADERRLNALNQFREKLKKPNIREDLINQFENEYGQQNNQLSPTSQGASNRDMIIQAYQKIMSM